MPKHRACTAATVQSNVNNQPKTIRWLHIEPFVSSATAFKIRITQDKSLHYLSSSDRCLFGVVTAAVYVQVDVLESQFSQLLQQINSTRDFESIRLAHDHFLSNLLAQSFILLKPVGFRLTCYTLLLKLAFVFLDLMNSSLPRFSTA